MSSNETDLVSMSNDNRRNAHHVNTQTVRAVTTACTSLSRWQGPHRVISNNSCESICKILTDGKSGRTNCIYLAYSPHLARLRQLAQFRLAMHHYNQRVNSEGCEICAPRQSARAHVLLETALAASLLMAGSGADRPRNGSQVSAT